jgi:ketosteroid isomerase-like protein
MTRRLPLLLMVFLVLPTLLAAKDAPDKALAQKVYDAWSTLDVNNAKQYYDTSSDNAFFDIEPLKYNNWKEYESGVANLLKNFKTGKLTINDDFKAHPVSGKMAWSTSTIRMEATDTNGKSQTADLRWTAIWENKGGKWLITHEHVSAPMP